VVFGALLFQVPALPYPDPRLYPEATERLTEFTVIVALMGAGLKLDREIGWRSWIITWRLLGITMPLSILGIALIGWGVLGLPVAMTMLLGAVLAPTDPVLAADVQVGPPGSGEGDEIRFSLTSEAGLNDGLAFPFVNLAIAMVLSGPLPGLWTLQWLGLDVLWKLAAGVGVGWLVGKALGLLIFTVPNRTRFVGTSDGFVAIGGTLIAYSLCEMAHGYGFLAVFISGLTVREEARTHRYHGRMYDFVEQTERLLIMALLVLFGGALAHGLLNPLTWTAVGATLVILFVVRPAAGFAGLLGSRVPMRERAIIGFFGIRGMGSFYYLAYALNSKGFAAAEPLWSLVGFVVLVSIVVHGVTATPVMRLMDTRRASRPAIPPRL
jgi:NhaP-type Na+/H+ and K+/H+ antiporters